MLRIIFHKFTIAVIYLLGYLIFVHLFGLPEISSLLIILVTILFFQTKLEMIFDRLDLLFIRKRYRIAIDALAGFEKNIERISHYYEFFPGFYTLFNTLFTRGSWLLYVYEKSGFRLVPFDTCKPPEIFPAEINLTLDEKKSIIPVDKLKDLLSSETGFNSDLFIAQDLDTLIPFKGKSQTVALLFTNHSELDFLEDRKIAEDALRIWNKAGQTFESATLYLDVVQKNLEIKKLFAVSEKILSSLRTEEILDFLLVTLEEVIPFEAGVIFLFDPETNNLYRKVSKGYKEGLDLTLKLGQGACGWVAKTRKTSLINDVTLAKHYYPIRLETRSQVSIPLEIHEELLGVLSLESDKLGHFNNHTLEMLRLFANQAAIALSNAKQYEISLTKRYLEHELVNARKVQKVLLPQHPPSIQHLDISFAHIPSKMVSGDLFDLAQITADRLGFVIGDVSGKGAAAAIMMSLVLAGFRAFKKSHLTVCEVVARLNNLLEESVSEGRYATLFYALISTSENTVTYSNAGHNPPLIFKPDGTYFPLSEGGIVLGYLANQVYQQKVVPFVLGDILLSYTDGITEALSSEGEEFGEARLIDLVKQHLTMNSYDLKEKILEQVNKFADNGEVSDDRTIVILKYR
ncbi:MAG: GAF domain-containing protein [Calditrichales bacterium]|nr:MAG: GAF domain-containing protein [Calditrichales bacterium]